MSFEAISAPIFKLGACKWCRDLPNKAHLKPAASCCLIRFLRFEGTEILLQNKPIS
jgi:hypothetical protein